MKTAARENPNPWATGPGNRAHGAAGQNRSRSIKWAAKHENFQSPEMFFFLTSAFIELLRSYPVCDAASIPNESHPEVGESNAAGKSGPFGRKICLPHSDSRRLRLAAGFRSEGNNVVAITDGKDRAAEHVRTYLKRVANLELPPLNWKKSRSR